MIAMETMTFQLGGHTPFSSLEDHSDIPDVHKTNYNQGSIDVCSNCDTDSCDVDNLLISSFSHLLDKYSMYTRETSGSAAHELVISGGLQQYLIRQQQKQKHSTPQPRKGAGSDSTTFHDLPDSLQLLVFSFLDAEHLCRVSSVCLHWHMLSCDDLLWHRRLAYDVRKWNVIGHTSNPYMYKECHSDWSNKDIYLRCCPEVNQMLRNQHMNIHQLSSLLRSLWPRRTPKLAMFGPGLESGTSRIVRKIIQNESDLFTPVGMFPGQFEGFGSGFTIKMSTGLTFDLTTLYTTNRHDRENLAQGERLHHNRMLVQNRRRVEQDDREEEEEVFELRQPIKDLCRTLDAFVFVVDATRSMDDILQSRAELVAMVNEMWAAPSIPVVVLSCIPETSASRLPCIDVVQQLQMSTLNRPWQVHNCDVETLEGVSAAIDWVVEQARRR